MFYFDLHKNIKERNYDEQNGDVIYTVDKTNESEEDELQENNHAEQIDEEDVDYAVEYDDVEFQENYHSTELEQHQKQHQQRYQKMSQQQSRLERVADSGESVENDSVEVEFENRENIYDYEEIDVNNNDHQEYIVSRCDFEQTEELEELKFFKVLKRPSRSLESWYYEMIDLHNLTHYPRKRI
jgi:hypothetical protein